MLRALRLSQPTGVPVLGVNLGRLGFLAEIDVPDLPEALAEIDAGNYTVETRVAVQVDFDDATAYAFNDVAVVRHPGQPVAAVEVQGRGPAVRAVRGGRDRGRHPDRVDRVQLLRRRADRLAAGRGAAGHPGRAALGVQPGDLPVRRRAGRAATCCRPAAGSRSRWTGLLAGTVEPGQSVRVVPLRPGRAGGPARRRPRSTSGPGASCGSPTRPSWTSVDVTRTAGSPAELRDELVDRRVRVGEHPARPGERARSPPRRRPARARAGPAGAGCRPAAAAAGTRR